DDLLRRGRAVGESRALGKVVLGDQRAKVAPGQREHADLSSADTLYQVRLALGSGEEGFAVGALIVGAQHRVIHLGEARFEGVLPVVEVVVAESHRVYQALQPRPLGTLVLVGPRGTAFVEHVATV